MGSIDESLFINESILNLAPPDDMLLDRELKKRIVYKALLSRRVEEKLLNLFSQGKLSGTVHTCIGQEFSGAVITETLSEKDSIFSNHRCHGHYLSRTDDVRGLISEIMGKETGVCGGIGGSQHLCKAGFYSNGIQGGIVPVSAGLALSRKLNGNNAIAVVFIGDGTLGEGVVYETMNIASNWRLPLLFVLENNFYSQSTAQQETLAGSIASRPIAFDIPFFQANTWNWIELYNTAVEATELVRSGRGPAFIIVDTYRLKAHSKGDDNRDKNEIARFMAIDPLNLMLANNDTELVKLDADIQARIEGEVAFAEAQQHKRYEYSNTLSAVVFREKEVKGDKIVKLINKKLTELMGEHDNIVFLGEDVKSPYGGAFKVSMGLSDLYPDRVFNTPISEGAITGIGCGLSLENHFPIVEIMFGDFLSLSFDQILNHASKFCDMYNHQVNPGMIIRTPMGGGRGYGPTHSQTLDRHFMGIPGVYIYAVNTLMDPGDLYKTLIEGERKVSLVIENKVMYGKRLGGNIPQGFSVFQSDEQHPVAIVRPNAGHIDVSIVTYGGGTDIALDSLTALFYESDIIAQIIVPSQIYPFDIRPYLAEIERGCHLVVIEEGQGFASFGSEIIAQVSEYAPSAARKLKRIVPYMCSIPAGKSLEDEVLVNSRSVINKIGEFLRELSD